jgi:GT2 family glycosyltransferase
VEQCLNSLYRALNGIEAEIYVVDNHSRDDTVEALTRSYPDVNLVASNHNLGFARANNIAVKQSESEYVLLINPDTFVGEGVISECLKFMDEHADAGALGVRMIDSNGNVAQESRRGLPTPMTAFYKMCGLCKRFPKNTRFGKYYMGYLPWDKPVEIEVVSGAFFMMRRASLEKVGLLDEDFFMYGEDIDLSYRLLKAGLHWLQEKRSTLKERRILSTILSLLLNQCWIYLKAGLTQTFRLYLKLELLYKIKRI